MAIATPMAMKALQVARVMAQLVSISIKKAIEINNFMNAGYLSRVSLIWRHCPSNNNSNKTFSSMRVSSIISRLVY